MVVKRTFVSFKFWATPSRCVHHFLLYEKHNKNDMAGVISAVGPVLSSTHAYGSFDSPSSCCYYSFFKFLVKQVQSVQSTISLQRSTKYFVKECRYTACPRQYEVCKNLTVTQQNYLEKKFSKVASLLHSRSGQSHCI